MLPMALAFPFFLWDHPQLQTSESLTGDPKEEKGKASHIMKPLRFCHSIQDSTKDKERKGIIHGILNALQTAAAPVGQIVNKKKGKVWDPQVLHYIPLFHLIGGSSSLFSDPRGWRGREEPDNEIERERREKGMSKAVPLPTSVEEDKGLGSWKWILRAFDSPVPHPFYD